jgi:hypothetical protein
VLVHHTQLSHLPGDSDARKRVDEVATEAQVFCAADADGKYNGHHF